MILRCALEAEDDSIARDCVASAKSLIDFLRYAKDDLKWDLADICLSQCQAVVKTMSNESALDLRRKNIRSNQDNYIERSIGGISSSSLQETNGVGFSQTSQAPVTDRLDEDNATKTVPGSQIHLHPEIHNDGNNASDANVLQLQEAEADVSWSSMFPDLWSMPYIDDYNYL